MTSDSEITQEMSAVVGMIFALEEGDFETAFTIAQEVGYPKVIVSLVSMITGMTNGMAEHALLAHDEVKDPKNVLRDLALSIARGDFFEEEDDCEADE